ncbi:SMI1/KNR4 family protein [Hymenobacter properus]|uniref:SMI1/KNR4 family protein n=1 Tax=Hymenobacter properus TaxID=2791026 RepID=A0A931BFI1_9BACT|nr:SMI1/KNR4 family protein [Hymenobacter properus]MBF9141347.1 SMI1/KNR4 family protein [Hymenobacter properus]MBR7720157.1 SMI1/KNR4 family protein [Microvirga sp. SRT04]
MTNAMQEVWARFENWLQAHAPQLLENLSLGASETALEKLAQTLDAALPDDFLAFYRIHNGQQSQSGGLINAEELLSVPRMLEEWTVWNDLLAGGDFEGASSTPARGIRADWWNPRWLPLTYDGAGNHCCLDLAPADGGTYGQVIRMWHDDAERTLLASSFTEWITDYVQALEAGQYVFSEDYDGILSVDDL